MYALSEAGAVALTEIMGIAAIVAAVMASPAPPRLAALRDPKDGGTD